MAEIAAPPPPRRRRTARTHLAEELVITALVGACDPDPNGRSENDPLVFIDLVEEELDLETEFAELDDGAVASFGIIEHELGFHELFHG